MTRTIRQRIDGLNATTKMGGAVLVLAGVVGLCWRLLAEPAIQKQIDKTTNPIVEVLEYQTYLMMQTMTDEQIKQADESYLASQRTRIKK